jgi:hypothetical protein
MWLCSIVLVGAYVASSVVPARAQSDLDALMSRALARRDEGWLALQQFILDERERLELRGPTGTPVWGDEREYTWFIRDGFFVRSPVRFGGAVVSESDRRKFEAEFLEREQQREKRERAAEAGNGTTADAPPAPDSGQAGNARVDTFLTQISQPGFISSAYFLRFKFEQGRYALVAREQLDGRNVLKVEYYPTRMLENMRDRVRERERESERSRRQVDASDTVLKLLNKGSRVTLWVEPVSQQIVRYTFENVALDFFPGRWLAYATGATASMSMGQPFDGVWLPRQMELRVGFMLATGQFDYHYAIEYHDYRKAEVTSTIRVPDRK